MRALRPFLIPIACFAVSWAIARSIAGRMVPTAPEREVVPMAPTMTKRERLDSRTVTAAKLAADFGTRPMSEWSALWNDFASNATAEELQKLPALYPKRRNGLSSEGEDLLQVLGREELAVRSGSPVAISPESFSALAEIDPEAAWDGLGKNNRADFTTAALRTLAAKDPMEALRRFQSMPAGERGPIDEGARAGVWHTPIGAIFGAWARRDPRAAAEAAMKLAPEDRTQAANHIGMTWAFSDGPAAIRYILDFEKSGRLFTSRHLRLDVMLRASFRTHPAETAKLMRESPMLRKMMGSPPSLYVAVKPWLDADPEGAFEWLFDPANESREDALSQLDADRDPATMERIVRGLAKSGSGSCSKYLVTLYRRDPELATSLADELSIPLREDASLEEIRLVDHPAEACDRWLAALREHGDPAEALASLGWTPEMAVALAAQAARAFPEKARQLAKLVPASSLDATNLWRRNNEEIALYWPELKGALKYPEPKSTGPVVPEHLFRYDPAAAAKLIEADPEKGMVESLVKYWAPYDLPAARDWLVRLPEGPARQQGELALAKFLTSADPEAALGLLDRLPADASSHQQWEPAIRRLLYAGGDWQRWLARIPGDDRQWLADELARESKVIEVARRPSGR